MSKQVIITSVRQDIAGLYSVNAIFWLTVAVGQALPKPGLSSLWAQASAAENAEIQSGVTIEEVYNFLLPATLSKAQIESQLGLIFAARQAGFSTSPKPGQYYGTFLDSISGWSA